MVTLTLREDTNKLSGYIDMNDFLSACWFGRYGSQSLKWEIKEYPQIGG